MNCLSLKEDGLIYPEDILRALKLGKLRFSEQEAESIVDAYAKQDAISKKDMIEILKKFYS